MHAPLLQVLEQQLQYQGGRCSYLTQLVSSCLTRGEAASVSPAWNAVGRLKTRPGPPGQNRARTQRGEMARASSTLPLTPQNHVAPRR